MTELHADPMALLRTRTSSKWRFYGPDVLPLWVAEMDYPLATPIASRLIGLIGRSDTGYDPRPQELGRAWSDFARDAWGWTPDPARVLEASDVSTAIVETVRQVAPGGRVIITSPVYPPFFTTVVEGGAETLDVPLISDGPSQWRLDLDGIEAALADGRTNLIGALRRSMATTGYSNLKEFQRIEVVVAPYETLPEVR